MKLANKSFMQNRQVLLMKAKQFNSLLRIETLLSKVKYYHATTSIMKAKQFNSLLRIENKNNFAPILRGEGVL